MKGQAAGAVITASYTYAHSLDNGSDPPLAPGAGNSGLPRNSFDLGLEYGNSDLDVRHSATIAVVYDVPVGMGAAHLNHGLVGHLLEGIQISGIETAQTGELFDLRGTVDNLHPSVNNRPEQIGPAYPSGRGSKVSGGVVEGPSASPTAFTNAPFGENVAIHRNKFYGLGFVNTDAVFQKTQTIFEQAKLVFGSRATTSSTIRTSSHQATPACLPVRSPSALPCLVSPPLRSVRTTAPPAPDKSRLPSKVSSNSTKGSVALTGANGKYRLEELRLCPFSCAVVFL